MNEFLPMSGVKLLPIVFNFYSNGLKLVFAKQRLLALEFRLVQGIELSTVCEDFSFVTRRKTRLLLAYFAVLFQ